MRNGPDPADKKRTSWVRWILSRGTFGLLTAFVALFVLLVGYTHSDDFQRRTTSLLQRLISHQTGEDLTIERVRLRFVPPAASIEGIRLAHHETGDPIVTAARIRVPLVLRGGGIKIGKLELNKPMLQLHLEKDGTLREFRNAVKGSGKNPLKELPFYTLFIDDGAFRLHVPDGIVEINHLRVAPVDGPRTDISGELHVQWRDFEERTDLSLRNVSLGPTVIDIPSLQIPTAPFTIAGNARYALNGPLDVNLNVNLDLDGFNRLLPAPREIHGFIDLDLHLAGTPPDLYAEAAAHGQYLSMQLPGVHTPILNYDIGEAIVAANATPDRVEVEMVKAWFADGTIEASAVIHRDLTLTDGTLTATGLQLEEALKAVDAAPTPWVDMDTDIEIADIRGPLKPLELKGDFDLAVRNLQVGDRPISSPDVGLNLDIPHAYALGSLVLQQKRIYLAASEVQGPGSRGSCTVDIGFAPHGPLDVQFTLDDADLSDFQPLSGTQLAGFGRVTGRVWGPFKQLQFAGRGDIAGFEVVDIPWADRLQADIISPDMKSLAFQNAVALKGRSRYEGNFLVDFRSPFSMHTDLTLVRGRVEDLTGMFIDLEGITGDINGYLSLHGPFYDLDGESHFRLSNVDLYGERFQTGEAHGYMDKGLFTLDDLRIRRAEGQEGLVLRGSIQRDYALNMEVIADGFALEEMNALEGYALPVTGALAAHATVTNTLFDPAPNGRITLSDVRYANNPVEDSWVWFETTNEGDMTYAAVLADGAATVDGSLHIWDEQPYALRAVLDRLPVHTFYPTGADGTPIEALASGFVDISGHFGEEWSPVTLSGDLDDVVLRWAGHELRNTRTWHYEQDGRHFALRNFALAGGKTTLEINASGGDGLALRGKGAIDADLLRLVTPGLLRSDGVAALDLHVEGRAPDVRAVAEFDLDAALMRHWSVPAAFEDVTARIVATSEGYTLEEARASVGGGSLYSSGTIRAEDWRPTHWDLETEVNDAQIQWVDYLPPAIGDATISFDGPEGSLLLQGDVNISEMTFTDRINWEDWVVSFREQLTVDTVSDSVEPWFAMDIGISADQSVTLRNNVAEGTASATLNIIGDTSRPGLLGRVWLNEGMFFLQDRDFRVLRAHLTFNDPWTWDPDLDFELLTEVTSGEQRYRITYMVIGPFSDWRTSSRSDPPLPQADVNSLLWFGLTTEDLEETGELLSAVVQAGADLFITDLFLSTQAGGVSNEFGFFVDRFGLATGLNARGEYSPDPRLLVSKRFDDLGDVELTAEVNMARVGDQYYRLDKRLSNIWTLSGWYATLERERGVLPVGGAFGVDVSATWESR